MEKRIELEKRARKANQITELNLDNCRSTSIVGLTDEYTALESLSLINVGLTTLKGFPKLPNLKKLELSDNRISNGLNYLTTSPKLEYLNLSGNKIKDLDILKPLEEFKNLTVLDLFNNDATQVENYREKIFKMLPTLKFLDGYDCNDDEAPSDGEEDDDVNGNDTDEDDKPQAAFCINGLEIDLAELEKLERRVQAKKAQQQKEAIYSNSNSNSTNNSVVRPVADADAVDVVDDLDELLKNIKLNEQNQLETNTAAKSATATATTNTEPKNMNFAILLYWFLAILNLANAVCLSSGEEEELDDENSDLSLSDVYNEDLEEDNSSWDENDVAEEDDEEDSDIDDADEANESTASVQATAKTDDKQVEESQARGKKRKHDG